VIPIPRTPPSALSRLEVFFFAPIDFECRPNLLLRSPPFPWQRLLFVTFFSLFLLNLLPVFTWCNCSFVAYLLVFLLRLLLALCFSRFSPVCTLPSASYIPLRWLAVCLESSIPCSIYFFLIVPSFLLTAAFCAILFGGFISITFLVVKFFPFV